MLGIDGEGFEVTVPATMTGRELRAVSVRGSVIDLRRDASKGSRLSRHAYVLVLVYLNLIIILLYCLFPKYINIIMYAVCIELECFVSQRYAKIPRCLLHVTYI